MTKILLSTLCACGVCCLVGLGAGCGGGNGIAPSLSGRAIHEVVGGPFNVPPRDSPLPQTLLSFHTTMSNTEVAQVQTDNAGSFALSLPAGTYRVDLADRAHQPLYDSVTPQDIVVDSGMSSQIDVKFVQHVP